MSKLRRVISQWVRSLRPQPLPEPKPSLRALELINQVPPPPPDARPAEYPSRSNAQHYLSRFVEHLRELAMENPEAWGHAPAIADRLDGHAPEELDRACFDSILRELQHAQWEAKLRDVESRFPDCRWLTTLVAARSYGEAVEAWLGKHPS